MNLDNLSGMPEWEDDDFKNQQPGEEWKRKMKNEKAARLYNQWRSVLILLRALCDSLKISEDLGNEEFLENEKSIILADAFLVGAKIRGAEAADMYILRMENAGIIRHAAQTVYTHMSTLKMLGMAESSHADAIKREIELFRDYFRNWIDSFEKDEFTDDWGLFR